MATKAISAAARRILDSRHPTLLSTQTDWEKWRLTYNGGEAFRNQYLKKYTARESNEDFTNRRDITPIPTFAKSAINDIRNSIFQRMRDIIRRGGSTSYREAVNGLNRGVDNRGSTMNAFFGTKVLEDLLIMGRVGVFVDAPVVGGMGSLADSAGSKPYLYSYAIEDILNWRCSNPEKPSEFQSILLRDTCVNFDQVTYLPIGTIERFRLLWIDEVTGQVNLQFYDPKGEPINRDGSPADSPIQLELTSIPFVMLDISDSLIKDVSSYQIALLNLVSSDVDYALKSNFTFYVEESDGREFGQHLRHSATEDGTATSGGQGAGDRSVPASPSQGRRYAKGTNPPQFINPSSEPLKASMSLQEKFESDIRKLVNLAVTDLGKRSSAESKEMDNQGLEAGLSYIGLVLESAERQIAEYWAAYETRSASKRQVATIKYPDRYSLKTDNDRIDEATKLSKLMFTVPGILVKKEIAKTIVETLLSGKVSAEDIEQINKDIDSSEYATSDPNIIIQAKEAGLVGERIASVALGFPATQYLEAREDHAARLVRIAESQGIVQGNPNAGSRGIDDLSADPSGAAREEKELSRNTDLNDNTKKPVRGSGNNNKG